MGVKVGSIDCQCNISRNQKKNKKEKCKTFVV